MLNKNLSLLAGLIISGSLLAQEKVPEVIGESVEVGGLVTVSDGANISNVVDGTPVVEGNRFVTSSTGSVRLKLEKGCDVVLKPNQAFTAERKSCAALIASIQSTSDTGGVIFTAGNGALVGLAMLGTAGFLSTTTGSGSAPPISNQ